VHQVQRLRNMRLVCPDWKFVGGHDQQSNKMACELCAHDKISYTTMCVSDDGADHLLYKFVEFGDNG
jgi:hypothetical protein